jgi:multiple sugar transport system substrate-binding protein
MRKLFVYLCLLTLSFSVLAACGSSGNQSPSTTDKTNTTVAEGGENASGTNESASTELKGEINLWSWFDTAQYTVDKFEAKYPGVKVNLTVLPSEEYKTKLLSAMSAGAGVPDVILMDANFVGSMIDHPALEDLTGQVDEVVADQYDYTIAASKDSKGQLKSLSLQATPGGFYYRRDLAKKYIGSDDPKAVSDAISTWPKLMDLGEKIDKESGGKNHALASWVDFNSVQNGSKTVPWVTDGKLTIAPELMEAYDLAKEARARKVEASLIEGPFLFGANAAVFATMQQGTVLFYPSPTWALNYFIVGNAPDTKGQWGIAHGPKSFWGGGIYAGLYSKSKNKAAALEMLKYWTGPEYLRELAKEQQDFSNSKSVMKEMAESAGGNEFIGGQNFFEFFNDSALTIKAAAATKYDQELHTMFINSVKMYVDGKASKDEAIAAFKKDVKNTFPDINVD